MIRALARLLAAALLTTTTMTLLPRVARAQDAPPSTTPVPVAVVDGRGHGHGVGLSQWGAYAMAGEGRSAAQILGHFYPGTTLAHQGGEVVVGVDRRPAVRLRFPTGGTVGSARSGAQAAGFPVEVSPGGSVVVRHDGTGFRVERRVTGLSSSRAQRFQDDRPVAAAEGEEEPCDLLDCAPSTTTTTSPTTSTTAPRGPVPPPSTTPTTSAPTTTTTAPPADPAPAPGSVSPSPVWATPAGGGTVEVVDRGRAYRGLLQVGGAPGALSVANHVDVESYLKGMAEVPSAWPHAAIEAQAVAARTYALRAMRARGAICDSERCQVYVGATRETAAQSRAVDATRGVVLTFDGSLAQAFYSASSGGIGATVEEGFGTAGSIPYLQPVAESSADPKPWQVAYALTDLGPRLGYPGDLTSVAVGRTGPSGRALEVVLAGSAGEARVDAQTFRRSLGLRSTLWKVSVNTAATPPPPPPTTVPAEQAAPEALAAVPHPRATAAGGLHELAAPVRPKLPPTPDDHALPAALAALLLAAVTSAALRIWGPQAEADGLGALPLGAPQGRTLPVRFPPRR